MKVGSKVTLTTDAFPGKVFSGEISAINPIVDTATRTVPPATPPAAAAPLR